MVGYVRSATVVVGLRIACTTGAAALAVPVQAHKSVPTACSQEAAATAANDAHTDAGSTAAYCARVRTRRANRYAPMAAFHVFATNVVACPCARTAGSLPDVGSAVGRLFVCMVANSVAVGSAGGSEVPLSDHRCAPTELVATTAHLVWGTASAA